MERIALTVTALTRYIKYKFDHDKHLEDVLLKGEISNFKRNVRGHFYFTLKDDNAQISVVMFASKARRVQFMPKEGMNVLLRGNISVYEVSGSYQLYADTMEEVGLGNLYQAYLQLKEQLEKQGLFDESHKKPLPRFPRQIAVLTSATGAAVRDIIHIINRRYPLCTLLIYPTTVQGEQAKHMIVENLQAADQNPDNDLIILGRGGGSIEDLWAFNEEIVARAIYETKLPVIAAVGHETDFTIADFVADKRAPTPSGAAEIAVPDQHVLLRDLHNHQTRLHDRLNQILTDKHRQVRQLAERYVLKEPARLLHTAEQRLDDLMHRLQMRHPEKQLVDGKETLRKTRTELHRAFTRVQELKQQKLENLENRLMSLDPRRIVDQGYILGKKDGRIIKSIHEVAPGDTLELELKDGQLETKVIDKKKKEHPYE